MVGSSWHRGCPVRLPTCGCSGWATGISTATSGVDTWSSTRRPPCMVRLLAVSLNAGYRIRRDAPVDATTAPMTSRSMNADSTPAFSCARSPASPGLNPRHAYGQAIDINWSRTRYVSGNPRFSQRQASRPLPRRKGMTQCRRQGRPDLRRDRLGMGRHSTGAYARLPALLRLPATGAKIPLHRALG